MDSKIKKDLELLSRKIYLEAPDLWIDFLDKVNDEIIDEMVLFFATKNDYLSIVNYAIANNIIDLKSTSKNNSFKNIYDHLMHTAKHSDSYEVYNFLVNINSNSKQILTSNENNLEYDEMPHFICNSCKCNIFECGYIVSKSKIYKFSQEHGKPIETANKLQESITCSNCNSLITNATSKKLELLCSITICSKCKGDLREVGIKDNEKLIYDKDSHTFISKHSHYTCNACHTPLNEEQKIHFNLT